MFACCRGGGRWELICLMEEEEREVDLIRLICLFNYLFICLFDMYLYVSFFLGITFLFILLFFIVKKCL